MLAHWGYILILFAVILVATSPERSPINWQEPFEVDGVALGARKSLILKLFGNPTRIRLSPGYKNFPGYIWEYPDRRIKLWNEQVEGIAGVELTQPGEVRLRKGDTIESSQLALGDHAHTNAGPSQVFQFLRKVHLPFPGAFVEFPTSLAVSFQEERVTGVCLFDEQDCSVDLNSPKVLSAAALPTLSSSFSKTIKVRFQTSKGDFFVDIYPEANTILAHRFLEEVEAGFYNDTPCHNVVPGFKVRFGINWREGYHDWRTKKLPLGPDEQGMMTPGGRLERYRLEPGTFALDRCLTINYQDLTKEQPEWPRVIGRVTQGMDVLESLTSVGDPELGLDEKRLWSEGSDYLATLDKQPDRIIKVEILQPNQVQDYDH